LIQSLSKLISRIGSKITSSSSLNNGLKSKVSKQKMTWKTIKKSSILMMKKQPKL